MKASHAGDFGSTIDAYPVLDDNDPAHFYVRTRLGADCLVVDFASGAELRDFAVALIALTVREDTHG